MSVFKKITTDYDEQEDRITICGLTDKNETVILRLTLRLATRLINHCINLLEKDTPNLVDKATKTQTSRGKFQNFIQESAEQQATKESAVSVTNDSPKSLIIKIDITNVGSGITLSFIDEFNTGYEVVLTGQQLRQWLGMLHLIWQKTEWPTKVWPNWMARDYSQPTSDELSIH